MVGVGALRLPPPSCLEGTRIYSVTFRRDIRYDDFKDYGAPVGTRTPNLLIRSQTLYPLSYECKNLTPKRRTPEALSRPGGSLYPVCLMATLGATLRVLYLAYWLLR